MIEPERDSILFGAVLSLSLVPYVLRRVTKDRAQPLSAHIAQDKRAIWFARAIFFIETVLIFVWYFGWYVGTHQPLRCRLFCSA